jgi:thiosulfate/3-mercaptopyruvate sulfurtransferase
MRRMLLSALVAGATALSAASAVAQGVFVSPSDVRSMRDSDQLVRILDVGRTHEEWNTGHIAGSIEFALQWVVVTRDGIPNELPSVAVLDSVFESWGIGDTTIVVIHGDPLAAARVWATLDLLGHPRSYLLDGGMARWRAEGYPLSDVHISPRAGHFTPRLQQQRLADAAWIRARLDDPSMLLVDARSPGEYAGSQQSMQVPRPGHIPGARSVFWRRLLQSDTMPTLRDRAELRRLLAMPAGTTDFVAYCRTGHMASMLYAVARELALPVKLYDPSFVEWSSRADLPVEQGPPGGATR